MGTQDISFLLKRRRFSSEVQLIRVSIEGDGHGGSVSVESPQPKVRAVVYGAKRSDMDFAPEGASLNGYFIIFYPGVLSLRDKIVRMVRGVEHKYVVEAITENFQDFGKGFVRALIRQEAPLVS